MKVFSELFTSEFMPQNPKYRLKAVTKTLNPSDFKEIRSEEQIREDNERRKESRSATAEEIAEEMKVPLADKVTPYHHLDYPAQIEKKREQLIGVLNEFSKTLDSDVKKKNEASYPSWYGKDL